MSKSISLRTVRNAAFVIAAVAAMCFMTESSVSAQSCRYGGGYGSGHGGHSYRGYTPSYRGSSLSVNIGRSYGSYNRGISLNYGPSYRSSYRSSYRRPTWHDTSHYDYHPAELRRHGNHLDYIPGHYDLHRTGHWHR